MSQTHAQHLPIETVPDSSPGRMSLHWGLVLLVVLLINAVLAFVLHIKPANRTAALVKYKWQLLEQTKGDLDVLILGDSSGNQSVDPAILKQELGIKSLNLCTTGGSLLLDDCLMLENYLAKHKPPRVVVLVHVYDVWYRDLMTMVLCQFPQSVRELDQRIKPNGLRLEQKQTIYLHRLLPIYSQHISLQKMVFKPFAYLGNLENFTEAGFDPRTRATPDSWKRDVLKHYYHAKRTREVGLASTNLQLLQTMNQLAVEHDFKLMLVMSPIAKKLYDEPVFQQFYHQITDQLASYAQQNTHVQLIFEKPITIGSPHMQNADHVLLEAAEFYTRHLARQIKPSLDPATTPAQMIDSKQ